MELTKITDLSYDRTFQLPWTTRDIARKSACIYCFSGTVMLVLASIAVPRLTLVCVCACSCVGERFHMWSHKNLRVGLWWTWFHNSTFHLRKCTCSAVQRSSGNIIFASCRRRSCTNLFLVGLVDVLRSCQQN